MFPFRKMSFSFRIKSKAGNVQRIQQGIVYHIGFNYRTWNFYSLPPHPVPDIFMRALFYFIHIGNICQTKVFLKTLPAKLN